MATITYHAGEGKNKRAEYRYGKTSIPASVVTRLLKATEFADGAKLDRIFYQNLAKYEAFLEALESANAKPSEAIAGFRLVKPNPKKTLTRASKVEKAAEIFAKGIVKRFAGDDPTKLVEAFLEMVNRPEFKTDCADVIQAFKKSHGMTPTHHIKTSDRKANPKALKALAAFRKGKGKK